MTDTITTTLFALANAAYIDLSEGPYATDTDTDIAITRDADGWHVAAADGRVLEDVDWAPNDDDSAEGLAERLAEKEELSTLWDAAVRCGAPVYRVMELDGQEAHPGVAENRFNAHVLQLPDGRWLYVDDVEGYGWIPARDAEDWRSGRFTSFLEPEPARA